MGIGGCLLAIDVIFRGVVWFGYGLVWIWVGLELGGFVCQGLFYWLRMVNVFV